MRIFSKKTFLNITILVLVFVFFLSGCGGNKSPSTSYTTHTGINTLLTNIQTSMVNGNASQLANCATYPVTEIVCAYGGEPAGSETYTYEEYYQLYQKSFSVVNCKKYNISNVRVSFSDDVNAIVYFTVAIENTLIGTGISASEIDEIRLIVKKIGSSWKFSTFERLSVTPA